ncbi:MAG: anion transporter [Ignavibacteriae bacterium]|nr:MAG: anion transporter [Ignavibacteriota bacterium]
MNIPVVTLAIVCVLIAVRQVGTVRLQIWQVMALGAGTVLISGQITLPEAISAINFDVLIFLFGMFIIGEALEESGVLAHAVYNYFKRAHSVDALMLLVMIGFGSASAILMNDTLAIIGTPVVLLIARKHDMPPKLLLLALAFSVTIGSVISPIGNPQNLLIALNGTIADPFGSFFRWLFIPTVINLGIAFLLLKVYYRTEFHDSPLKYSQEPIRNHNLAFLSKLSFQMVIVLIALKILSVILRLNIEFRLTYIAVASALPILVGSRQRWSIVRKIDWQTLAFFAAMFVLMDSVWRTEFFQHILAENIRDVASTEMILSVSILLSQLISNVPLVALYQPLLIHAGTVTKGFMALAAGSTIAGNLFILGAASNIIIIQNAEKKSHQTITFWEFARIGIPLTILNGAVYWLFFSLT